MLTAQIIRTAVDRAHANQAGIEACRRRNNIKGVVYAVRQARPRRVVGRRTPIAGAYVPVPVAERGKIQVAAQARERPAGGDILIEPRHRHGHDGLKIIQVTRANAERVADERVERQFREGDHAGNVGREELRQVGVLFGLTIGQQPLEVEFRIPQNPRRR